CASRGAPDRLFGAWAAAVRARDPRSAVVGYASEVVTLLPVPVDALQKTIDQLATTVAADVAAVKRTFSTGAGRVTEAPDGLPAAYEQARQALQVGRQPRGKGAVATFDELGGYRLLARVPDAAELRGFVRGTPGRAGG